MSPGEQRFRHGLALASFAALIVYWAFSDFFGKEIIAEIAVFAILAISLDLVAGYAGMVSLGHGALLGFGAYMFAGAAVKLGVSGGIAVLAASASTGLIALAVGLVVSRVHGIFFIMATLAIGEMGYEYFFKSKTFGGDDGFAGIPRLDLSALGLNTNDPATFALLLILVAAVVYLLAARLLASPYGWALVGLHENEGRMRALGLPTRLYKASVIGVSGLIAGLAGSLAAMHTQFITPQLLHWTTSGEVLIMIILGGLGTLVGPVIGAAIVILLRHELSGYTDYWGFWLGAFLIAMVLSRGNGVVGWLYLLWRRFKREGGHAAG
ncbi:MAG: branched-chain amino acid ABC transporter permease [Pseudomonadota bacterium]